MKMDVSGLKYTVCSRACGNARARAMQEANDLESLSAVLMYFTSIRRAYTFAIRLSPDIIDSLDAAIADAHTAIDHIVHHRPYTMEVVARREREIRAIVG